MTKISASLAAMVLVLTLTTSATIARAQDRDDKPPQAAHRAARGESHPVIEQAIRQLQQTKYLLEHKAAHDFHGHRVQAIQSIDQALAHLHEALESDKK